MSVMGRTSVPRSRSVPRGGAPTCRVVSGSQSWTRVPTASQGVERGLRRGRGGHKERGQERGDAEAPDRSGDEGCCVCNARVQLQGHLINLGPQAPLQ